MANFFISQYWETKPCLACKKWNFQTLQIGDINCNIYKERKKENDDGYVPGTEELEYKNLGVVKIIPICLHFPANHPSQGSRAAI